MLSIGMTLYLLKMFVQLWDCAKGTAYIKSFAFMNFWIILNLRYFSMGSIVNRKEALKIFGFSPSDNANE
ncbi:hypothetical protein GOM44_06415 [Wolbachia endosymbiont of Atemnus politus]|uniref:hypothetical protein n=1 Tax=Wolbachia endosymbiont of Atemnus politus TaxID=2682840 RepID=UPI0019E68A0D|nr:hypothetical protein [Wolbachia endosymbiont of Atemnus politus]NSX83819.1 hypothetical protein [Wolbachia endosymbiont of Atemnus politus]